MTMTWNSFHRRGEILRTVTATADVRGDGILPMDVEGVAETFGDELSLLGALQLRWHTRLAGRIERELMSQPMDLEQAVIAAWLATADELPGVLAIVDHYRAEPRDDAMALALAKSADKEHILLAVMAGRSSAQDAAAARVGAEIENAARAQRGAARATTPPTTAEHATQGLLDRIKAVIAA
jgi:hypothetical protein